jgi:hypothetical protein
MIPKFHSGGAIFSNFLLILNSVSSPGSLIMSRLFKIFFLSWISSLIAAKVSGVHERVTTLLPFCKICRRGVSWEELGLQSSGFINQCKMLMVM